MQPSAHINQRIARISVHLHPSNLQWQNGRSVKFSVGRKFRVSCGVGEEEGEGKGEEPPESLFMKELRRRGMGPRGMNPTSLLEESKKSMFDLSEEPKLKEDDRGFSNRDAISAEIERELSNQRERSIALNSEGLEGLIPRAKLLLTLGGTFFIGFWPLILITVALFSALYFYFGPAFVHDASKASISPPPYIDPYELLEEDRIARIAPRLN